MMNFPSFSPTRYLIVLISLLVIWSGVLAINPPDRETWALENVLAVIGVFILIFTYRRFQFSLLSYTCIFIFLILHEIGSHYTYAEVPYDAWLKRNLNWSLNDSMRWERNHFDRLVHFLWGFLFFLPVYEIGQRFAKVRGIWAYLFPLSFTMSTSLLYELIEWAAALVFGGDLGIAYLGTQGDVWDSHKDSFMATLGVGVAIGIAFISPRKL